MRLLLCRPHSGTPRPHVTGLPLSHVMRPAINVGRMSVKLQGLGLLSTEAKCTEPHAPLGLQDVAETSGASRALRHCAEAKEISAQVKHIILPIMLKISLSCARSSTGRSKTRNMSAEASSCNFNVYIERFRKTRAVACTNSWVLGLSSAPSSGQRRHASASAHSKFVISKESQSDRFLAATEARRDKR